MGSGAKAQAILEHLNSGCLQCGDALELLRRAEARGFVGRQQEPPDYAVESVKEAFALRELRQTSRGSALTVHRPIVDASTRAAVPLTTAEVLSSRQLLYHCVCHTVTLRVDYDRCSDGGLELDGEVLHRLSGPVEGVPVYLTSGERVLALTFSGDLGHFSMRTGAEPKARLGLLLDPTRYAEIDLFRPLAEARNGSAKENLGFSISNSPQGYSH